ncbi:hypothetical protein HYV50_03110 [Candidatus Pacearchaeota archaeon]|nr:hypothetical protein [Candidatus Pacearchaeota archaeon]
MSYNYVFYVIETIAFEVVGIAALFGVVYFSISENYFLSILSVLAFLVALDNFFCSSRAKKCGLGFLDKGHYVIPPLFRLKKGK